MRASHAPFTLDVTRLSVATPYLPPGVGARIDSVFRAAVNAATPAGLIALAPERAGGLPNGLLVAGAPDFRDLGLRPGMTVIRAGDMLRLGDRVALRLEGAVAWDPRVPAVDTARAAGSWARHAPIARRTARAWPVAHGLARVPGASAVMGALARAIGASDRRAATAAGRRLVGLGPGLTPSGDDVLAGIEAALHALGHPVAGFVEDLLDGIEGRTTAVSAALLRHAARGEASERVHELLGALLDADDVGVGTAVERAAAWGACSGIDGVTGVLLGLDAACVAHAERGRASSSGAAA